jgi:hypothetical protein
VFGLSSISSSSINASHCRVSGDLGDFVYVLKDAMMEVYFLLAHEATRRAGPGASGCDNAKDVASAKCGRRSPNRFEKVSAGRVEDFHDTMKRRGDLS